MKIPSGYQTVMPYLILDGAQKFIEFAEKVFGAKENKEHRSMRNENIIQHGEIYIGENIIMFADSTKEFGVRNAGFFIYVEDADETFKKAIDSGASVIQEVADQPYGRSGGVRDPFGNDWWITTPPKE
jgi:PhnB protein